MAFQPAPGIVKVEMRFGQQGQLVENVYHVHMTLPVTFANLDSLASVFASWFTADVAPEVSSGLQLRSVVVTDISVDTGISVEHTTGLPASGTDANAQPPMNVTVAVRWNTGLGGRSYRGRTYHLGLTVNKMGNSTLTGAEVIVLHNLYLLLMANVATTTNYMVVLSRRNARALRPAAIGTQVTGVTVDDTTDSQRRRLPGRGR